MNPSRPFILRPVATSLLMIALVLVGLVAVRFLPISSLPDVDYPTIQVQTFYPGASPQVMATTVTAPLEVQLGEIPSLTQMISRSSEGSSVINLQFSLAQNLDVAEQNVQEAINGANSLLPSGLPAPPIYAKVNPADQPIITFALTSKTLSLTDLEDIANDRLASKLSEVPGVGQITPAGGHVPAIRVEFDPHALAAHGLGIDDLRTLLATVNVSQPKGNFDGPALDYTINSNDQIRDPREYLDTVVAYQNGAPVFLRDVATVKRAAQDVEQGAWYDRTPAIVLNVLRQPGANVIATVDAIKARLPGLLASLPHAIRLRVVADSTGVIRASVADAGLELALSIALVVLVIFVFLRNAPATLIPSISVPVSLIGTLSLMYELGYSIDNLSLMALIVATGFVVDDSIVMIENIVRYLEEGMTPIEAALAGAGQIGFTIVSLTVSLIAVLIPLLFMGGVIGRLFSEFAVTLAVTILFSAVVSLTLVPMMCARILRRKSERHPSRFEEFSERAFDRLLAAYQRRLGWVLDHEALTLGVATLTVALTLLLYATIPKGLFPVQDVGVIQGISIADNSVSYRAMTRRQRALSEAILKDPDVTSLTSYVGIDGTNPTLNQGRFLINLRPPDARTLSAAQIAARIRRETAGVPGIRLYLPTQTAASGQVPLGAIAKIRVTKRPLVISHLAQFPAVTISFDLAPGASLSTAIDAIHRAERAVRLPPSITSSFQGAARAFESSLSSEAFLLLAALATVYIVLGVLYESYIHPVTILSTLPSAGIGALLALMIAGKDLDVIGIIGIVLLIGIVKKNGIMIVDFALEAEREHGKSPREAILQASILRFRPILMTTFAAILGALPLLVGTGTGSELRRPLGIAIIGGLVVSQVLTLFTTPVIYLFFDRLALRVRGRRRGAAAAGAS